MPLSSAAEPDKHERQVVGQRERRFSRAEDIGRQADAAVGRAGSARSQRIHRESGIECVGAEALVEADEQLRGRIEIGFRDGPAGELLLGRARHRPDRRIGRDVLDDAADVADQQVAAEVRRCPSRTPRASTAWDR